MDLVEDNGPEVQGAGLGPARWRGADYVSTKINSEGYYFKSILCKSVVFSSELCNGVVFSAYVRAAAVLTNAWLYHDIINEF
ncbi:hypothetical protein EVAR_37830_1 [Eumeta japonica]|uniref:Uncharacterized protein n=1 Tax=Eumeta variegata TaxID=151549 RepID=A0A4C1X0G4_EUMVA|nr:hypothetical protein EVAR_37830_1 [Eumeta japonica]